MLNSCFSGLIAEWSRFGLVDRSAALFLVFAGLILPHHGASAAEDEVVIGLPVTIENRQFSEVTVRASAQRLFAVSATDLAESLESLLTSEVYAELLELGHDLVPPESLEALGIDVELVPATLTVAVRLDSSARRTRELTIGQRDRFEDFNAVAHGQFSFGLTTGLSTTEFIDADQSTLTEFDIDGFTNVGGIEGISLLFGGRGRITGDFGDRFQRDRIIALRDNPDRALRWSAGDLAPRTPQLAGNVDLLGVSFERDYQALQPTRNIRPTGRRTFTLDRPSTLEIYVNGVLVTQVAAEAGRVNLDEIPLTDISNDVVIVVEDALGRREIDAFSLAADLLMLEPGLSEFSVSAGALRDLSESGFEYTSDVGLNAIYRRGMSERMTLAGNVFASTEVSLVGASVVGGVAGGVGEIQVSASTADEPGGGFAAALNFRGGPYLPGRRNDSLNLRAEYFTRDYATPSDPLSLVDIELDLSADYRFQLASRTTLSVGGSIQERHDINDRATAFNLGVTQGVGAYTFSIIGRYSERPAVGSDSGVFLSISRAFGRRHFASASHDTLTNSSRAEIRRNSGFDLPNFDYRLAFADRDGDQDLRGRVRYTNSRMEARLDASALLDNGFAGDVVSGRVQSGLAFVDGRWATSRDPGRGFTLFTAHESLEDAEIEILRGASQRRLSAGRGGTGRGAVVPTELPYRPQQAQINVIGAPIGYDLGEGRYILFAGERTGAHVEIGQDGFRTVVALMIFEGEPVELAYGVLVDEDTDDESSFFTNRSGRAAFSEMAPGRYRAEFRELGLSVRFEIPEGDDAFIELGELYLEAL